MPIVDNLWMVHRRVIVLEDEAGVLAFDGSIMVQVDRALTLSSSAHSTPILVICLIKSERINNSEI